MPGVEPPRAGIRTMAGGVDATYTRIAQMSRERAQHGGSHAALLPLRVDRHVVELGDQTAARRRDRVADDACADGLVAAACEPDKAQLRACEQQVQRLGERRRAAIAISA